MDASIKQIWLRGAMLPLLFKQNLPLVGSVCKANTLK